MTWNTHELLYCLELDLLENTKYDGTTFFLPRKWIILLSKPRVKRRTTNARNLMPMIENSGQILLVGIGFVTCEVRLFTCAFGYGHTFSDRFSCRHEKLFGIVWTPIRYVTLHIRDRRGVAWLRDRNRAELTGLMCEQKPYPVKFSCRRKSYPAWCENNLSFFRVQCRSYTELSVCVDKIYDSVDYRLSCFVFNKLHSWPFTTSWDSVMSL